MEDGRESRGHGVKVLPPDVGWVDQVTFNYRRRTPAKVLRISEAEESVWTSRVSVRVPPTPPLPSRISSRFRIKLEEVLPKVDYPNFPQQAVRPRVVT